MLNSPALIFEAVFFLVMAACGSATSPGTVVPVTVTSSSTTPITTSAKPSEPESTPLSKTRESATSTESWNSPDSRASRVNDFLYQLQDLNLTAIGSTACDLVIIDYSADGLEGGAFSRREISRLRNSVGGQKIVLAYMSIGEAEDYRLYWQGAWDDSVSSWVSEENPNWPGNYKVRYWTPEWQSIIFRYVDGLLDAGLDGAYLDIIDAYEFFEDRGRHTATQDMADFVAAIADYARASDPGFLIFPQNAPQLAALVPEYLDTVDGIGQEDIYFGYQADGDALLPK